MNKFRTPVVAGLFYPSSPDKLKQEVAAVLSSGESSEFTGKIFGIIAPHAGYLYSGKTAAYAYNLLSGSGFKKVIIISPSHTEYFRGCCIYEGEGYKTPLGNVEIDTDLRDRILKSGETIFTGLLGHKKEHGIEVHLPFLQTVLNDFKIVPIVMGDQSKQYVNDLASAIAASADEDTLVLASSDLSHFYSRQDADKLDSLLEKDIISFDYDKLQIDLELKKCEACGGGPIAAMMKAAGMKGIKNVSVLHRSDSGTVSGDLNEVVGYLSAVVFS